MTEPVTLDRLDPQVGDAWVAPGLVAKHDGSWRLVGARCTDCGASFFPTARLCAFCLGDALEDALLPRHGKLHSVTQVSMAPPGFEAPYSLGWVDIGDLRVFGPVLFEAGSAPEIGDAVETTVTVVRRDGGGLPVYGHAFRPAQEGS